MSDFDYYYAFYDKARGSEVLDALRQGNDQIKAEAIDYLIDRGYLHSEEIYNSAYVNALGDYLGISEYGDDEEEFEAPVGRGTKHSALDEVHQRLREAGKKRRQQRIAQARLMKQSKYDAEDKRGTPSEGGWFGSTNSVGTVRLKIDYNWWCDFSPWDSTLEYIKDVHIHGPYAFYPPDFRFNKTCSDLVKQEISDQLLDGNLEGYFTYPDSMLSFETDDGRFEIGYEFHVARMKDSVIFEGHHGHHHAAEMEMTPDIMDYPGLPVVPDSYGTNSALDSGNGVPQWYGSAEDEDEDEELEYVCDICGDPAAYNFQDSTIRWTIKDDDFVGRPKYSEYSGDNQNDFYCEKHAKQYEDSRFYAENLVTKEAPFAGAGSLFKFGGNDSALGGFTAKELTESSAIHGDFDHAALNYSGHQNIEARAEGEGEVSERVYIRFSWESPSEHDRIIDEYTITDNVFDEVYQEVQSGNYSGVGSYTYYYDQEDDEGNTEESEFEIEYEWG